MLGYIVSGAGIETHPNKTKYASEALMSQSRKELQSLLINCWFNRRLVHVLSHITAPLHELPRHNLDFVCNGGTKISFYELKDSVSKPLSLAFADANKKVFLHTFALK